LYLAGLNYSAPFELLLFGPHSLGFVSAIC
jgi:hypothetical protein